MSNFVYRTTTNTTADSKYDVLGHHMPARIFFFVTVEEVGKDGMLVRRTYSTINDPYLKQLELSPLGEMREVYPEKYGLWSKGGPKVSLPPKNESLAEQVNSRKEKNNDRQGKTGTVHARIQA